MKAPLPQNEAERLRELHELKVLDSPPVQEFDNLVALASRLVQVPIALVSLVDKERQWFKAKIGTDICETPREHAFCAHAILEERVLVVPDATLDDRFADSPLVTAAPHIRFYAGAPLRTARGMCLGTLCVIDTKPRTISDEQIAILEGLAREAVLQFELRRQVYALERALLDSMKSERRFSAITNAAPILIWTSDQSKVCDYFNTTWLEYTGRTMEQERGSGWASGVHPEDRSRCLEIYESAFNVRRPFEMEYRLRKADGSYGWIVDRGAPAFDEAGRFTGYVGACFEITEQREISRRLAASEERFNLAVQGSSDGIWDWINVASDEEWWSSRFYNLLGYDDGEISATLTQFRNLLHPEDVQRTFNAVQANHLYNEPFDIEYRLRTKSGVYRWFRGRADTLRDSDGTPRRMAGSITDITKQKLAESSLQSALATAEAATASKSLFLANMSHEIRTPLTAILGYADCINEDGVTAEERSQAVVAIISNGRHLLGLINDLLDLSKIEAGAMKVERVPVSPWRVVEEVRNLLVERAASKNISLLVVPRWPLPECITSDPVRLTQVLINLVGNAIKFTEHGGVQIEIEVNQEKRWLQFVISDTGIGMSSEQLSRLFKPFSQADASTTRKFGGTGLGLAISAKLVRDMGGDISVSSIFGSGSQFRFHLPVEDAQLQRTISAPPSVQVIQRESSVNNLDQVAGRILIADDAPDTRRLIQFMLRKSKLEIVFATNGQEVCDITKDSRFDLILMDMYMPVMDGHAATRMLRERGLKIPIIAFTANATSFDKIKCMQSGCSGYLSKPIDRSEFFSLLSRLLTAESPTARA